MSSYNDYPLEETIHILFTSRRFSSGATFTLGGTPALSVYEDAGTTEITSGVSVSADHDSVTGLNLATIVATAANGYEAGKSYHVVVTTGTVDSVSVTGEVVGAFTIDRAAAVRPTTAGRTLDISAGGEAGVDWANVGSPTTAVDLSATDIQLCDTTTTVTGGATASALATVDSNVDAILVDTGTTLPATLATAANLATVDSNVDAILVDTGTTLPASIATVDSNVDAILVDTGTTIPATLGTPADTDMSTDIATIDTNVDAVKVITDALTAAAAANLALSAAGIIGGATSGTPTTTASDTDLSGYANDELIGRVIIFTGGTADGQASDITDYANTDGVVTYTAITTAPAASDTFVIV